MGDNSCLLCGLLVLLLLVHGHGSDHLLDLLHLSELLDHSLRGLELHDLGLASLRQVLGTVHSTSTITTPHQTEPSEHHTTCGPSGYDTMQEPAGHHPAWEPSSHHTTWEPSGHHHTGEPSGVTPALNYQTRPKLSSKLRHQTFTSISMMYFSIHWQIQSRIP